MKKKDKIIKVLILCCISITIILVAYTYYRAEIYYKGLSSNTYQIYYYVFLISLIFWIIILFLPTEIQLNIILIITPIFILFYVFEIFLHVYMQSDNFTVDKKNQLYFAKKENIIFDERSKYAVVKDFKQNGIEAVP